VLNAGQSPDHSSVADLTWERFSVNWNNDVKSTFLFGQEVIRRPLRTGSTMVILSSGAALGGFAAHRWLRGRQTDAETLGFVPLGHFGPAQAGRPVRGSGRHANDRRHRNRRQGIEDVRGEGWHQPREVHGKTASQIILLSTATARTPLGRGSSCPRSRLPVREHDRIVARFRWPPSPGATHN